MQHPDFPGLYPAGEGAGYAGGITSSALDGISAANQIALLSKMCNASLRSLFVNAFVGE